MTPWTVALQDLLSVWFSRQENWSGLPFSSPGDLPDPRIEPTSPIWLLFAYYIYALECKLLGNRNCILFTTVSSTLRKVIIIEKSTQIIFLECWIKNIERVTVVSFSISKLHEMCLKTIYFSISTFSFCFLFWKFV